MVVDLNTRAVVSVIQGHGQEGLQGVFLRLKRACGRCHRRGRRVLRRRVEIPVQSQAGLRPVFKRMRHVIRLMNEKLTILRRDLYRELTGHPDLHTSGKKPK